MLLNHNQILNPMPELVKRRPYLEIFPAVGIYDKKGKMPRDFIVLFYPRTPNSKPPLKFVPASALHGWNVYFG